MSRSSRQLSVVTPAGAAIHVRVAGALVGLAAEFDADVRLRANGRTARAESILEILSLGVSGRTRLSILASGPQADVAADRIAELVLGLKPASEEGEDGLRQAACLDLAAEDPAG